MISLLYAHPYSRHAGLNPALMPDLTQHPKLQLCNLYEQFPDFYFDVAKEQQRLAMSDALVLQFPTHWGLPPALLCHYLQKVCCSGWAYGRQPDGSAARALAGKPLWLVTSAATPQDADSPAALDPQALLLPMRQLAWQCGLVWQAPLCLPNQANDAELRQWSARYRQGLDALGAEGVR